MLEFKNIQEIKEEKEQRNIENYRKKIECIHNVFSTPDVPDDTITLLREGLEKIQMDDVKFKIEGLREISDAHYTLSRYIFNFLDESDIDYICSLFTYIETKSLAIFLLKDLIYPELTNFEIKKLEQIVTNPAVIECFLMELETPESINAKYILTIISNLLQITKKFTKIFSTNSQLYDKAMLQIKRNPIGVFILQTNALKSNGLTEEAEQQIFTDAIENAINRIEKIGRLIEPMLALIYRGKTFVAEAIHEGNLIELIIEKSENGSLNKRVMAFNLLSNVYMNEMSDRVLAAEGPAIAVEAINNGNCEPSLAKAALNFLNTIFERSGNDTAIVANVVAVCSELPFGDLLEIGFIAVKKEIAKLLCNVINRINSGRVPDILTPLALNGLCSLVESADEALVVMIARALRTALLAVSRGSTGAEMAEAIYGSFPLSDVRERIDSEFEGEEVGSAVDDLVEQVEKMNATI